jgi:hypothetical protein
MRRVGGSLLLLLFCMQAVSAGLWEEEDELTPCQLKMNVSAIIGQSPPALGLMDRSHSLNKLSYYNDMPSH